MRRWVPWGVARVTVVGHSMEPTYSSGRTLWITSLPYCVGHPARGDVVACYAHASQDRPELKRIIGLPNDTVAWAQGGRMQVNAVWLEERYVRLPPAPPGDQDVSSCVVGPRHYFVVGDNRLHSRDSRQYGPIPRQAILGKVIGG